MTEKKNGLFYLSIIVVIAVFVGLGYLVFQYFAANVITDITTFNLFLVAIVAGIAAFFNPCSFPLIPAYISQYYTSDQEEDEIGVTVKRGISASLGLITFNILLGILIATIGAGFGKWLSMSSGTPNQAVRVFRGVIGVLLLYLGYSQSTGKGLDLSFLRPEHEASNGGTLKEMYFYGFMYPLLGIGCGGPILAALSVFAVGIGGFTTALVAFVLYSLIMGLLMVLISLLTGFSKDALMQWLKSNTATIKRVSGVIVVLVGLFLIWSSIYTEMFVELLFPK